MNPFKWILCSMNLLRHVPPPSIRGFRPFGDGDVEQSIPQRFEQHVRARGDETAVQWHGGSYTYAALNATANRLARAMLSRGGSEAEPVALVFEHGGEALAAIMAVLKAGKFYVVLDAGYPADRLKYMLEDSGARLMVADVNSQAYAQELCGNTVELLPFDDVDPNLSGADLANHPAPDALAMIMYTSGSTGGPKGVMHSHRSILADARNHTSIWSLTSHDRHVLSDSLSFASSVRTIYGSLLNGAAVFPYDVRKDGFAGMKRWLLDNEITVVRAVPTSLRNFMATLDEDDVFPATRVVAAGGEPILRSDVDNFNRHFLPHCILSHSFGPTETLTVTFALVPHGTQVAEAKLPIGHCAADRQVVLVDESGREVADGEVGEITVRSRYLSSGYWRDPDRTRAAFLPGPGGSDLRTYLTGDLGRRGTDGVLVHVGRRDSQVKIRGVRVEVSEIESALRALKGIRDAVVVGREAAPGETRLVAYFVESGAQPISTRTLREQLAQTLPGYMVPSVFIAMAAIPQTASGKTDHQRLPPPILVRGDLDGPLRTPRNTIEIDLVEIWKEILGVEQLSIDDEFLNLGGDSLKAAQIASRAAHRFRCDVQASAPMLLETVARMAEVVAAATGAQGGSDVVWPDQTRADWRSWRQ
jgi:amino acid adenylation domain-containing protein